MPCQYNKPSNDLTIQPDFYDPADLDQPANTMPVNDEPVNTLPVDDEPVNTLPTLPTLPTKPSKPRPTLPVPTKPRPPNHTLARPPYNRGAVWRYRWWILLAVLLVLLWSHRDELADEVNSWRQGCATPTGSTATMFAVPLRGGGYVGHGGHMGHGGHGATSRYTSQLDFSENTRDLFGI